MSLLSERIELKNQPTEAKSKNDKNDGKNELVNFPKIT
jgi:hypothetical protein